MYKSGEQKEGTYSGLKQLCIPMRLILTSQQKMIAIDQPAQGSHLDGVPLIVVHVIKEKAEEAALRNYQES